MLIFDISRDTATLPAVARRRPAGAGTAERRTQELLDYWRRDVIAAMICVRGGYGSNCLLDKLDYSLFV